MPGTSYPIEKNFINALPLSQRDFAIKVLYSLSIDEVLVLATLAKIEQAPFDKIAKRFDEDSLIAIGQAVLLTKLTYIDVSLLNLDQLNLCVKSVRLCFYNQDALDLVSLTESSHPTFSRWLNQLLKAQATQRLRSPVHKNKD